jgi:hypothetical protein
MSLDRRSSIRIERRLRTAHVRSEALRAESGHPGAEQPALALKRVPAASLRRLAWVRDLSVGGAFLEGNEVTELKPGELLGMRLYLPYSGVEPLSALAEVVRRCEHSGVETGVGLAFIHLPDRTAGWLRFLSDAEVFDAYRRLLL